jgi:hypothetical protein
LLLLPVPCCCCCLRPAAAAAAAVAVVVPCPGMALNLPLSLFLDLVRLSRQRVKALLTGNGTTPTPEPPLYAPLLQYDQYDDEVRIVWEWQCAAHVLLEWVALYTFGEVVRVVCLSVCVCAAGLSGGACARQTSRKVRSE